MLIFVLYFSVIVSGDAEMLMKIKEFKNENARLLARGRLF